MDDLTKIALVLNKELGHWRAVMHGVLGYAHGKPEWILHSVTNIGPLQMDVLRRWRPAGVIADVQDQATESWLMDLKVPVVSVSNYLSDYRVPRVGVDDHRLGEAVARHLLDRGLRSFAYFGRPDRQESRTQRAAFEATIRQAGIDTPLLPQPPFPGLDMSQGWTTSDHVLATWLLSMPRPLGLMLCDDDWGLWFTQVCRKAKLRVPDDVAIVGVNDNRLNCELSNPPLSSIGVPLQRIGHDAAALLDRLMAGEKPPGQPLLLPPLEVTVRASSNILAIDDPDLRAAVRFIADSSHLPITVDDVLREVPVSRRVLERKFRKVLGRSPSQEIRRVHIERAKRMLAYTDASLQQVSDRCGFGTMYHLCRIFRRETGQTPMGYRKQFRLQ